MLDVGSGTGILCAAFYEMVRTNNDAGKTRVIGIEHIQKLAELSVQNLNKSYSKQLQEQSIKIVCGDGRLGYEQEAPYDVINVGAGTQEMPIALIQQLKVGGKLIIPVGPQND